MESNANFLQPKDDDLLMPETGRWSKIKLDYLEKYLDRFIVSMRPQKWRAIHYIDLFSGSGKNKIKNTHEVILGSPLVALTRSRHFDVYFFSDNDPDNIAALKQRCAASDRYLRVKTNTGDANECVNTIMADINRIDKVYIENIWPSLNLAFLDPFGLELEWRTVKTLAQAKRMDLIIYYSQMGITSCPN